MNRSLRLKLAFAALASLVLLLLPLPASATRQQMRIRAEAAVLAAERVGFSCRNNIEVAELENGQAMVVDTTLYGGVVYAFLGAGDENIQDLDLELYDRNWNHLESDNAVDPTPIIQGWSVRSGSALAHLKVVAYRGSGWATAVICYKRR